MELLSLERSCGLYIRHICYVIFSLIFLLSRLYTDTFVLYLLIYGSLFILYINLIIINNIFAVKIKFRDSRERERQRNFDSSIFDLFSPNFLHREYESCYLCFCYIFLLYIHHKSIILTVTVIFFIYKCCFIFFFFKCFI
jgi:hypothetical protein